MDCNVIALQITHVITTFGRESGSNRTADKKPFMSMVEKTSRRARARHYVWPASNTRLGRTVFAVRGRVSVVFRSAAQVLFVIRVKQRSF
jgi:hypothetical protein